MQTIEPQGHGWDEVPTLRWHISPGEDAMLVELEGELDTSTAPELRDLLEDLLLRPDPPQVLLDLSRLEFLDSTGITAFLRVARLSGGSLRLRAPTAQANSVLKVMKLEYLVE